MGTVDQTDLEAVPAFCYYGDLLSAAGGCDWNIRTRRLSAWNKFKKLCSVLTTKNFSPRTCGHFLRLSRLTSPALWDWDVGPNMLWLQRLQCHNIGLVCYFSIVQPLVDVPSVTLHKSPVVNEVSEALRVGRLRWYGHFQHAENSVPDSGPVPCIYWVT